MRLLMPAFGAFAGGLNVGERAFADVFDSSAFTAYVLGEGRIYALPAARCVGE
jgi:metallophosphoesterase superfamily enzyme